MLENVSENKITKSGAVWYYLIQWYTWKLLLICYTKKKCFSVPLEEELNETQESTSWTVMMEDEYV